VKHEKIVRDKIPQIMRARGQYPRYRVVEAGSREKRALLGRKLQEECTEFLASVPPSLEELADVLEVVYALAEEIGSSRAGVERLRREKHGTHGGFVDGVVLTTDTLSGNLLD
jgi:predicted house-cleaning noncanonical NTP pyrophosphatase (MazG superfamily)